MEKDSIVILPMMHNDEIYFVHYPLLKNNKIHHEPLPAFCLLILGLDSHNLSTSEVDSLILLYRSNFIPSMQLDYKAIIVKMDFVDSMFDENIREYALFNDYNQAEKVLNELNCFEPLYLFLKEKLL